MYLHRWLALACVFAGGAVSLAQSVTTRTGEVIEAVANPTDRAIVEFHAPMRATRRTLEADLGRLGSARVRRMYTRAFNGAAITLPRRNWQALAKLPYVKRVHPDLPVRALMSRSVPQVGAPQVWAKHSTRGRGITIAVIDTGIDYTHPSLGGGFGPGFRVSGGWDFVFDDADPMDDHGHGTHVAGIAAANSAELTGVAPEATLLAYKVLDGQGKGMHSDIIAAIDRAIDPNGDGDTADAADVINLSLGGPGSPDDPVAQAVENAIANGVVVVCAAGNDGDFFRIGSPAAAPGAITVGNAELGGALSPFTSKGPNTGLYTIKPEVVAPGEGIVSAWPAGGTRPLSGTSMAAPHVAGAAALLRAVHPGWTPADIKSALVSSAHDLKQDVMAQGAGRIDVSQAVEQTVFLDPATLGFGLADVEGDVWSPSQRVRITNRSSSPVTLADPVAGAVGLAVPESWTLASPATVVAPGQSADVTISMTIDHRGSPYPTGGSLSYGGIVSVAGARTKWAFVKASRIRIRTDEGTPLSFVSDDRKTYRVMSINPSVAESILPAGTYDVVTWIFVDDGEGRLAVREQIEVKGTSEVSIPASSLRHTITPAGLDESGQLLSSRNRAPGVSEYQNRLRLVYPAANLNNYFDSAFLQVTRFRTNDIPRGWHVLIGEFYADAPKHAAYAVQHPILDGVSRSVTLQTAALREQKVRVVVPHDPGEVHEVQLGSTKHDRWIDRRVLESTAHAVAETRDPQWSGSLFLTPDVEETYGFSPSIGLGGLDYPPLDDFELTPVRLFPDGRAAVVPGSTPGPATQWHAPGSTITLGGGPVHPRIEFTPISPTMHHAHFFFHGPNGERRWRDMLHVQWEAFNGTGQSIGAGLMNSSNLMVTLPAAGPLRLDLRNSRPLAGGKHAVATYTAYIDTRRADAIAPAFTALSVQDAGGAQLEPVPPGREAWLLFGITDLHGPSNGREHKPIVAGATHVQYRAAGTAAWIDARPELVVEDILTRVPAGRTSDGAVYRCRIPAVPNATAVDLRFFAEDAAGNRIEYTLEPAFAIGEAPGSSRKRSVRH
jgi:Subtilase family